jgi:hypothetical protein
MKKISILKSYKKIKIKFDRKKTYEVLNCKRFEKSSNSKQITIKRIGSGFER